MTTYTIGHDVLAQFDSVNGYLALMADGHGSTRGVTNSLGQMVQQYSYDAYGNAVGFDPAQAKTNLLYSGEQFNPVSGLQYLRARWYNPENGRFNRLDPYAGNKQSPLSFHKYAYAHMNPVMNADPSGLLSSIIEFVVAGGIVGILGGISASLLTGNSFFSRTTLEYAGFGLMLGMLGGALAYAVAVSAPTIANAVRTLASQGIKISEAVFPQKVTHAAQMLLGKLKGVHSGTQTMLAQSFCIGMFIGFLTGDTDALGTHSLLTAGAAGVEIGSAAAYGSGTFQALVYKTFGEAWGWAALDLLKKNIQGGSFMIFGAMVGYTSGYYVGAQLRVWADEIFGDAQVSDTLFG